MPYFIETYDDARQAHIRQEKYQEHLNYLESIAPKLLACGAKLDDSGTTASGGVYLVDVDTRVEAKTLIQADPFYQHGLFRKVEITRWRKAYLEGQKYI